MYIIIDIETIPNRSTTPPEMPVDFVKYGNTKDVEKRKVIEEEYRTEWKSGLTKKMSVTAELCQIISCGYIILDNEMKVIEKDVIFNEDSDIEILQKIISLMKNKIVVGWASKHFDIPVIWKRAIMQNIIFPFQSYIELTKKYDTKNHIDLMHVWNNGEYGKMSACADALDIECKTGMDGSMIFDAYKKGEYEAIKAYNMQDCETCISIMKRIGIGRQEILYYGVSNESTF